MQFRLRTLLIVVALGPPVLAGVWFAIRSPNTVAILALLALSGVAALLLYLAFAALAASVCFGLQWLLSRYRLHTLIVLGAGLLLAMGSLLFVSLEFR